MIVIDIPLARGIGDPTVFLSTIKEKLLGRWGTKATVRHADTRSVLKWQFLKNEWVVRLEFNPSRFQDPDGCSLVSAYKVPAIIQKLLRESMFYGDDAIPTFAINEVNGEPVIDPDNWHIDWEQQIRIARLDTSVDFLIEEPEFHLGLYSHIRPAYAKGTRITYGGGLAETFDGIYKTRDGVPKMYSKYQKAKDDRLRSMPPEGLYRFEFQYGRKSLQRIHIHNVGDLTQTKFEQALRSGWRRSRLETPVYAENSWIKLITKSQLAPGKKSELIGFLTADAHNVSLCFSESEASALKELARSLGITFGKDLKRQGERAMKLDLETQTLQYV